MRIGTILKARRINFLHYLLNQPKEGMLSKFFYAQWQHSSRLDWTEQVKMDLFDFGLPRDLELLESRSTNNFKNLIKKKAREFELRSLVTIKKTQSKMKNLKYDKLKLQEYLQTMDTDLATHVLRFRLRMASFSENFKGQGPQKFCPLCGIHPDSQAMSFQCGNVKATLKIEEKYENIFKNDISLRMAKLLKSIVKLRDKLI